MHSTAKAHIQLILQRIKQALWEMDKKYGLASDYFNSMQNDVDTIATSIDSLNIFCKMNIESLKKLIELLKNQVAKEDNEVIKEDLNNLINTLETELVKKIKELN